MGLKGHGKCKNKKKFNFLHKTNFNAEFNELGKYYFVSTFVQHKSPFPMDLKIKFP